MYEPFPGTYVKDGESTNIVIIFATAHKGFIIYDEEVYYNEARINDNMLYGGFYKVRRNKLYYNLAPLWREETGIKTIVFEKVSDYEDE